MNYNLYFKTELDNEDTNYFILDTHSDNIDWDIDFIKYSWQTSRFNKMKEGDLFIYRRPKRSSENKQFYFFGAGKIDKIIEISNNDSKVFATIDKAYPLLEYIYESDLNNFKWTFKNKGNSWAHFFNQYGMNKINKEDFIKLLTYSENNIEFDNYDPEELLKEVKKIDNKDYSSDDKLIMSKSRRNHTPFANSVKRNYNSKCAICSISTRSFLIASHIIPWADNIENRLNPENAICLCSFHDNAFDKGYISLDNDYKVITTSYKLNDDILKEELSKIDSKKIELPNINKPNKEFLKYHRDNIFEKFK